MKKLLTLTLVFSLVAAGALAAKEAPRDVPKADGRPYIAAKMDLTEGFEDAWAPAGWTVDTANPAYTWVRSQVNPHTGAWSALVPWQTGQLQDEVLSFVWPVDAGDDLAFATAGSVFYSAVAPFTVEINGAVVYDFNLENGGVSWVWEEVVIDLEPYAGTSPTIAFRYAGDDGANQYLDSVRVGPYSPPPPPDDVSFCDLVSQETGTHFTGTTCDGENLVWSLGCENYSEYGREKYYEIVVPADCHFTATVTNTADGALWLLADCVAPGGAFTCLDHVDDTLAGAAETLVYDNQSGSQEIVYLVIDSYGADSCGDYVFDFASDCAVAEESASFGSVKAMFR